MAHTEYPCVPPQVKASFGQALDIGNLKTRLNCEYDRNANKDFLSEASLSGNLLEPSKDSDVAVSYDVTHNFADAQTSTKLVASTKVNGNTLSAELDGGLSEISAERDLDLDEPASVQASWLVKAKTARVKLMSKLGGGDSVSAQVDYTPDGGKTAYEVTLDHNIGDGRDASVKATSNNIEVDYVDNKFESAATWTASASVPLDSGSNMLDAAKLSLKRAWKW